MEKCCGNCKMFSDRGACMWIGMSELCFLREKLGPVCAAVVVSTVPVSWDDGTNCPEFVQKEVNDKR